MRKKERNIDKTPYVIASFSLSCVALIVSALMLYYTCKHDTLQENDVISCVGIIFGVVGVVFTTYFLIFAYRARIIQDEAHSAKTNAEETFEEINKKLRDVDYSIEKAKDSLTKVKNESQKEIANANNVVSIYNNILCQLTSLISNPNIQPSLLLNHSRLECLSKESSLEKRRIAIATIGHILRNDYEKKHIQSDIELIKKTGEKYNIEEDVQSAVKSLEKQMSI